MAFRMNAVLEHVQRVASSLQRRGTSPRPAPHSAGRLERRSRRGGGAAGATSRGSYPGDATRLADTGYAPEPDGRPDPGEVVWTWVPYEEDHTVGKDRPVLLVGRDDGWLVGLPLTSRDHDRDTGQERAAGREWVDIGTGPWDRRGRPSEVRVNRLVRVDPRDIRREGAVLPRVIYEEVIAAVRRAGLA